MTGSVFAPQPPAAGLHDSLSDVQRNACAFASLASIAREFLIEPRFLIWAQTTAAVADTGLEHSATYADVDAHVAAARGVTYRVGDEVL